MHIAEARVEEERLSKELRDIERLIKRVESKEIEGDKDLLHVKKKQLEEAIGLAKTKIRLTSMLIMIRENMNTLNKLFDQDNFKLLLNVEEINKYVDKELGGLKDVDINKLYQYFNDTFPLILEKPEKFVVKEQPIQTSVQQQQHQQHQQHQPTQPPTLSSSPSSSEPKISLEQVDNMLKGGSIEEWIELIKSAVDNNEEIKILPGNYEDKEGYRNLLKAIYLLMDNISLEKLKGVIKDKLLLREAEYLKQLKNGSIEIIPESSDRDYIDNILNIICEKDVKEEIKEAEIIKYYKLSLKDREMIIERRVVRDPITKKAQKIIYTLLKS
jgi:hypothetical protein